MNRRWWLLLAGVLSLCGLGGGRAAADKPKKPDAPRWLSDWEEGKKAARASAKPIFVVFRCEH
jgi:hypothetical protein